MTSATSQAEALTFDCAGDTLVGVLHRPTRPSGRGVVIVVGGPQYRVGAHRQNVQLARHLADAGLTVLRFDYRGMGDSAGIFRGFEDCDADIRAAVACLRDHAPEVTEVVLWGLCDAAAAIAFHVPHAAPGVVGAVLLNPWVRTEDGLAATRATHYYGARLRDPAFWRKLAKGGVNLRCALGGVLHSLRARLRRRRPAAARESDLPLPQRVAHGLERGRLPMLLILSGDDLTAREFEDGVLSSAAGKAWLARPGVTLRRLPAANHTYARRAWRDIVHAWGAAWVADPDTHLPEAP